MRSAVLAISCLVASAALAGPVLAQRGGGADELGSPWGPGHRRATPSPDVEPDEAGPSTRPGTALPDDAAPQSIVAIGSDDGRGGAHHFEDGEADELPWPDAIEASRPLGSPHFVVELSGGFLAPLTDTEAFVQLVFGVEAFTGILRFRFMLGCAWEALTENPTRPLASPPARQGGGYPMARFTMGGDVVPWLGIRVAAGAGVIAWNDVRPAVDGALEVFVRLTDDRRLELGLTGGPSMRLIARETSPDRYNSTVDLAARMGVFIGGVL